MFRKILAKIRGERNLDLLVKNGMKLGQNYSIANDAVIDGSHCWLIDIGDNVTITARCIILAHDASMKRDLGYAKIGNVKIGNNVFIGVNSVILPNSTIGENTIVGAGSVVCGELEANSVYVGCPARKVATKESFLEKHKSKIDGKCPVFGEEYTLRANISDELKADMKSKMGDMGGYVR